MCQLPRSKMIVGYMPAPRIIIVVVKLLMCMSTTAPSAIVRVQSAPLPLTAPCRNACGSISINYPFGLEEGCGAPEYRGVLNCTGSGDLFFQSPSGSYRVRSIGYDDQSMVIYDPGMSTCTILQPHRDFAMSDLQWVMVPPSPDTVFALLNCSVDSPVLNHYRSLCFNVSGHSCDELYGGCAPFRVFRAGLTGVYPPCCFTKYNTVKFMSMNILDCTHYTTIYDTDSMKGVGPLDWSYGIQLSYTVPNAGCERCTNSGGTCGYNTDTEGMLCLCSAAAMNFTRDCGGNMKGTGGTGGENGGSRLNARLFFIFTAVTALVTV